jgi:hypothetical protein
VPRPRTVTVTVEERVVVVTGWHAGTILRAEGLRPIYAGTRHGWMLDRHRLPDVLAILQHRGIDAVVTKAGAA